MKRILSVIIILTVVLSSFSAFAAPADVNDKLIDQIFKFDIEDFYSSGTSSEQDPVIKTMEFLQLIGIWDNVLAKDALITMTDFSVIMARTKLGAVNAFEGVYEFEPNADNKSATYRDAYIYIIDALGYRQNISMYKDEAQGALIVADQLDLISENPENIDAYITRGELAKLIDKALVTDMCIMEHTDYGYNYVTKDGEYLLNKVHGIFDVSGFVNAVPGFSVIGSPDVREGFIQIDRDSIRTDGKDYNKFIGRLVKAYAKYDEVTKQNTLIYMDYSIESNAFEVDFSQINSINSQYISYMNGDVEEEFSINNLKYVVENGTSLSSLADISYSENEGKIIFTESENNGDIDTAIIYKYEYFVVEYYDNIEKKIGFKFHQKYNGNEFMLIDEKVVNVVYINDMISNYSKLTVNSAIRVMKCEETGYTEIIAVNKPVSGEVAAMIDNIATIGDKDYRIAKTLLKHINEVQNDSSLLYSEKTQEITLGTSGQFYLVDNIIVGYQKGMQYLYGYLKDVDMGRTSIDPELKLRIFTQNSEWLDLTVSEKIELDEVAGVTKEQLLEKINRYYGSGDFDILNKLVRFKANGKNEIVALDTVLESNLEQEMDEDIKIEYIYSGQANWTYWWISEDCPYFVDVNTYIFVVPDDMNDEEDFRVIKNTSLPYNNGTGPAFVLDLYSPNEFMQTRAAVYHGTLSGTGSSDSVYYMHIEKIRKVVLDEENMVIGYKVSGQEYLDQRSKAMGILRDTFFYVKEKDFERKPLNVGDFVTAELDSKSNAESYTVKFPGGKIPDIDSVTATGSAGHEIIGTVKRVDVVNSYIVVESNGKEYMYCPRAKGVINLTTNKSISATMSDFHPGDRVFMRGNYGHASLLFKNIQ